MHKFVSRIAILGVLGSLPMIIPAEAASKVNFDREIRPILSDHCYACHGPDENTRKAGLRLDQKESTFSAQESGMIPVVPGDLEKSELIFRITTDDEDDQMPPAKHRKPLSQQQIALLKQWVAEGAEWQQHWAYVKPERPAVPPVARSGWARNEIDHFILRGLETAALEPSPEAPKERLLRRVTLDLTGLPPTVEEMEAFMANESPQAYEQVVDRLLQSKAYGERQAMFWLDLARYGETQGYHHDNHRDMWHWRDWVIQAFNENKPFDQFTVEQLAGDLLPQPSNDQLIATGFHRNEMTTSEGGALPEEYAVKYVVGRVDTTARVWMGTSLACAECHDHKYDPITQKEYYQFFAFFNNVPENGLDAQLNPVPRIELKTDEQEKRLAQFNAEISALELAHRKLVEETNEAHDAAQAKWEQEQQSRNIQNWGPLLPAELKSQNGASLTARADNRILASGENSAQDRYILRLLSPANEMTGLRLEALPDPSHPKGQAGRSENGEFILTRIEVKARATNPAQAKEDLERLELGSWKRLGPFAGGSKKEAYDKDFGPESGVRLDATVGEGAGKLQWREAADWTDGTAHPLEGKNAAFYFYRTVNSPVVQRLHLRMGGGGLKVWLNGRSVHTHEADRKPDADPDLVQVLLKAGLNELLVKAANGEEKNSFYFQVSPDPVLEHAVPIAAAAADASRGGYPVNGTLDDLIETGWSLDAQGEAAPHYAWFRFGETAGFRHGTELEVQLVFDAPIPNKTLGAFRLAMTTSDQLPSFFALPDHIRALMLTAAPERTSSQNLQLQKYYREQFVSEAKNLVKVLNDKKNERRQYEDSIPVAMTMREKEQRRETRLLVRGEYNNPGEKVAPGVPQAILPWSEGLPPDRLGLARWLLHADHPLTSRVVVNQFWQQHFGSGLVKTAEDFGAQGERPSHPDLLDWLATEFIRSGWDMKKMHRLMVTSAAYRQDSTVSPTQLEIDPGNRWLARFPRQRLAAEAIRDVALSVSGLLHAKIGGPSIFPYQPPGLWEQVTFEGTRTWEQNLSKGEDNYRRGLYVYWRRSIPYASFVTFDAPTRETCTVRRPRTNTPLQALVLMNDPVYVEAARAFGQRIMKSGGDSLKERVRYAFRTCLSRDPSPEELDRIAAAFDAELAHFLEHRADANQLVHVGATPPPSNVDIVELAAWTIIGQILMNLDETITKG